MNKDCLIVDDLCDGGYTFLLLGKALKDAGARKVYLYISHGYFSKGFWELHEVLDHIYCTNSVKDIDNQIIGEPRSSDNMYPDDIKTFEIKDFLTQYNVI